MNMPSARGINGILGGLLAPANHDTNCSSMHVNRVSLLSVLKAEMPAVVVSPQRWSDKIEDVHLDSASICVIHGWVALTCAQPHI